MGNTFPSLDRNDALLKQPGFHRPPPRGGHPPPGPDTVPFDDRRSGRRNKKPGRTSLSVAGLDPSNLMSPVRSHDLSAGVRVNTLEQMILPLVLGVMVHFRFIARNLHAPDIPGQPAIAPVRLFDNLLPFLLPPALTYLSRNILLGIEIATTSTVFIFRASKTI